MGGDATSVHRGEGMVSIMGVDDHPWFVYRELVDPVRSSLFSMSPFLLYNFYPQIRQHLRLNAIQSQRPSLQNLGMYVFIAFRLQVVNNPFSELSSQMIPIGIYHAPASFSILLPAG